MSDYSLPVDGGTATKQDHDTEVNRAISDAEARAKARANHTGTQPISTVVGLNDALNQIDQKADEHIQATDNPHSVTKAQVGLGNVDNTSDADKPVSTAQQVALDAEAQARTEALDDVNARTDGLQQIKHDLTGVTTDRDGVVLSGYDEEGTFTVARLEGEYRGVETSQNDNLLWGLKDLDGVFHVGLKNDGMFAANGFGVGDAGDVIQDAHPNFYQYTADRDGLILFGVTRDGQVLPRDGQSETSQHDVILSFVEPWLDPSENLMITWLSTSEDATVVEYKLPGASSWVASQSFRTREFPALPGVYLHTAVAHDLFSGTRYAARWPGSGKAETFKTAPKRDLKIAVASDFQSTNYFGSMRTMGEFATTLGNDLFFVPGDHVMDQAQFTFVWAQRWLDYLTMLFASYRSSGGDLIPTIALTGNHEGDNPAQSGGAQFGGEGDIGFVADIFSWSYAEDHPTRFCNSAATMKVGSSFFLVTMETDHTEPLPPQIDWVIEQVSGAYDDFDHIMVMGHVPAFYPANEYDEGQNIRNTQARALRQQLYPGLAPYADKITAYVCGHSHVLAITSQIEFLIDEELTPEQNDQRFTQSASGIVQIGTGPAQAPTMRPPIMGDEASDFDGTPVFLALLGFDDGQTETTGTGLQNVQSENNWHWWQFLYDGPDVTAVAYGDHNLPYYQWQRN